MPTPTPSPACAAVAPHTPLPWRYTAWRVGGVAYRITHDDGRPEHHHHAIAGVPESELAAANAAFIVKAVNSHAALVAALEACQRSFEGCECLCRPARHDEDGNGINAEICLPCQIKQALAESA